MRPPRPSARLVPVASAPGAGGIEGDDMRKTVFELYLAWLLVFGGSTPLLRRTA
ncbi:hypothetical protein [Amnibacterium setariae]|uniref:hypothetical protein n=1 Tax=Amnibacterium setariae TaxID=2306585 RepID=UPI0013142A1F|nr:hypothetical protein [Amnibacterium setariae]